LLERRFQYAGSCINAGPWSLHEKTGRCRSSTTEALQMHYRCDASEQVLMRFCLERRGAAAQGGSVCMVWAIPDAKLYLRMVEVRVPPSTQVP
jgi:hypothetical protein